MLLADVWAFFEEAVFSLPSTQSKAGPLFNPYADCHPDFDLPQADAIRRANLRAYLESFTRRPPLLIIGEAPGWRGCRFSGVPFTSEAQLCNGILPFVGTKSSRRLEPYAEGTASIFWGTARALHLHFLVWNCMPLHPHRPGDPLTNRRPSRDDLRAYQGLLQALVERLSPQGVIAIGKSAEVALRQIGITPLAIRHPSYGGARDFRVGLGEILTDFTVEPHE